MHKCLQENVYHTYYVDKQSVSKCMIQTFRNRYNIRHVEKHRAPENVLCM